MMVWKMYLLSNTAILDIYVRFQGCIHWGHQPLILTYWDILLDWYLPQKRSRFVMRLNFVHTWMACAMEVEHDDFK